MPRFLATLAILEDPAAYGFELPALPSTLAYDKIDIERPAELKALDKPLGLEPGTLAALNPELRRAATPDEAEQAAGEIAWFVSGTRFGF